MSEKNAKKLRRQANGPKACVMCGQVRKRTEEHLLPSWLVDSLDPRLLAGNAAFAYLRVGGSGDGLLPHELFSGKSRIALKKSVRRISARVACGQCNNEWMSAIEDRLTWLKAFLLEGNGKGPRLAGTIYAGQLIAMMPSREQCESLAMWAAMKAVTLGLGWSDLGHVDLAVEQIESLREIARGIRVGVLPDTLEVELIHSFLPNSPLGVGLVLFGRSFVFAVKVQSFWLRVTLDHPLERHRLLRVAHLGSLVRPWQGESRVRTMGRVEHFTADTGREEGSLVIEGVGVCPELARWSEERRIYMPMDVYRDMVLSLRRLLEAWTGQRRRQDGGG